ncbi:MAG: DUF4453 domain-containing protein [Rhodobacter sp.]|nr:DUF4453 domain-containing protein [Rhodobacter sp.]
MAGKVVMPAAVLAAALLAAGPAAALEICDDLWFTRNLLFHQAGQCFGSALGQAVFGNEGCDASGVELGAAAKAMLAVIRAREAEWACSVDTSQTSLAVPELELRMALEDLPVANGYESACVGWKGARLELRAGRRVGAAVTGVALAGDTLLFQFDDAGDWTFVELIRGGAAAGSGWARLALGAESCEMMAG